MKKLPPIIIIVVGIAYLAYLAWRAISAFTPVVGIRLALSVVLFYFVLRGSRTAGNILAVLSGVSALVLLVAAVSIFTANAMGAVIFAVVAGLLLTFSTYLLLSPSVRAFQATPGKAPAP